jgi:hypothetical protein
MSSHWRKSSFSAEGDCLEWAMGPSSVRLRDSKDPTGPQLVLNHSEWAAFIAGIKHGEADLPSERGRWSPQAKVDGVCSVRHRDD